MGDDQRGGFAGPPGWRFYGMCTAASIILLYAVSVPGLAIFAFALAGLSLLQLAVVWFVKLRSARRTDNRSWWLFLIAPVGGGLVLTMVLLAVPLDTRWSLSRSSFASEVTRLTPDPAVGEDRSPLDVPARLGLYSITAAYRVHGGVIFYEETGNLFDDAGFAYLPDGPTADLATGSFESPQFRHLGGPWYSWNASW